MKTKEIFENAELRKVEDELVRIFSRYAPIGEPYGIVNFNEEGLDIVRGLFAKRKKLLNEMFVLDEEYHLLLNYFNQALEVELMKMRRMVIESYNTMARMHPKDDVRAEGRCYMACGYPKLHPVQTQRAKQMWKILCGACGYYDSTYKDGVLGFAYKYDAKEEENDSENLLYALNNLRHKSKTFSIFDLLWVRDFKTDVTIFIDNHSKDVVTALDSPELQDDALITKWY